MTEYCPLYLRCSNGFQGYEVSQAELNISIEAFLQGHAKGENPNEIE